VVVAVVADVVDTWEAEEEWAAAEASR